jgi:hypothetical protein
MPPKVSVDQSQRIHGAILAERIYMVLYSASSARKPSEETEQAILELDKDLTLLEEIQDRADPDRTDSGWKGMLYLKLETRFICQQLRVMILRRSTNLDNRRRCLITAREAIASVEKIRIGGATIGGATVLRR